MYRAGDADKASGGLTASGNDEKADGVQGATASGDLTRRSKGNRLSDLNDLVSVYTATVSIPLTIICVFSCSTEQQRQRYKHGDEVSSS